MLRTDQMPLHRKNLPSGKTLNFVGQGLGKFLEGKLNAATRESNYYDYCYFFQTFGTTLLVPFSKERHMCEVISSTLNKSSVG